MKLREPPLILRRAGAVDREYAKAIEGTLNEWLSENDDEAYREL